MKITSEQMHESGTIDLVSLLSAIEEIKRTDSKLFDSNANELSTLIVDNIYFILNYDLAFSEHYCPSRMELLARSEYAFRIIGDRVDMVKSKIFFDEYKNIFNARGIQLYHATAITRIDEE